MYVLRTSHFISLEDSCTWKYIIDVITLRCKFYQYSSVIYSLLDDVYLPYHCLLDGVLTVHVEYCAFHCAATDNDVTQVLLRAWGVTFGIRASGSQPAVWG